MSSSFSIPMESRGWGNVCICVTIVIDNRLMEELLGGTLLKDHPSLPGRRKKRGRSKPQVLRCFMWVNPQPSGGECFPLDALEPFGQE